MVLATGQAAQFANKYVGLYQVLGNAIISTTYHYIFDVVFKMYKCLLIVYFLYMVYADGRDYEVELSAASESDGGYLFYLKSHVIHVLRRAR